MIRGRLFAVIVLATSLAGTAGCSSSSKPAASTTTIVAVTTTSKPPGPESFSVGETNATYVDARRPTPANGSAPVRTTRSLPTLVLYPARGSQGTIAKNAPPDTKDGPYPLIVFAHGLGGSELAYRGLLERWAAAGFVVAAPRFPLSNSDAIGGIDPGDYIHQPGDMSYVITAVLEASARKSGPLSGLVDADHIGAAGHSLGGITTLGLAANTCCLDERLKAAIVMSGDTLTFPNGIFAYGQTPPLLFVHGTNDALVPYESSIDAFNLARGPKGILTVVNGDHASTVSPTARAFPSVVAVTLDFFDAYLKGDAAALTDIDSEVVEGVTRAVFDAEPGSATTVPTTPSTPPRDLHATASAVDGLTDGQVVTVDWSGYTPNKTVNVVQCSQLVSTDASACDLKHGALLQPDPTGTGSADITVVSGTVGTGTCDSTEANCVIVVNDGGSLDPAASVRIPITFAPE